MTTRISRRAIACALLTTSALSSPALAQLYSPPGIPPIRQTTDQNGVDVTSGTIIAGTHSVSIGPPGPGGMSWSRTITGGVSYYDSTAIVLSVSGSTYTLSNGGSSESFTLTGSNYVPGQGSGSTLTLSGTTYTYTTRNGTVYTLVANAAGADEQYRGNYHVSSITYPTGEKLTFNWEVVSNICHWNEKYMFCTDHDGERLRSVTSTNGYQLAFTFMVETPNPDNPAPAWAKIATVVAQNMSVDPASKSWPTLTFTGAVPDGSTVSVADSLNRTTTYTYSAGAPGFYSTLVAVKRPGASSNNETISWNTSGVVSGVTLNGVASGYTYSTVGSLLTTTVTDANSHTRVVKTDTATGLVSSDTDELGKTTSYTYYSPSGLLHSVTAPELNSATYTYDGRGNLIQTTVTPKTGSPLSPINTYASYPASGTNAWMCATAPAVTCNKPVTTTDAMGNVTNFAWDSSTGLPTSVTSPAPATGAVQPQTRYSYTSLYGEYLSGGSLVNFATPVTRLSGISQCQTKSACTGGDADEVKTSIAYTLTGVTNANALPLQVSEGAGNAPLPVLGTFTWDTIGNQVTIDGPLTGAVDVTKTFYDADREPIGVAGPGDPTAQNRAKRLTYNPDGQVTKTEIGTVADQSAILGANFTSLMESDTSYDANARPVTQGLASGGTTYSLTQASYDTMGRLDCSAVRMNTAAFGSLPVSACTLGTQGSDGPDQITKMSYDADSRPLKATIAYGTSDQADERTLAYSDNGQLGSLTDGENNKTSYIYDGFDRLSQTQYPSATKGAGTSNPGDYEQLGYDPNSNVLSFRNRAAQTISYSYDNLNRVSSKGGAAAGVNYSYDNLGRSLSATFASGSLGITNSFDALSRLTSTSTNMDGVNRTLNSGYDAVGNRTSLTGNSGYGAWFGYYPSGEFGSSTDSNGATIAIASLDSLGRRSALGLGINNTSWTGYGYDGASRLTSIARRYSVAGSDADLTFGYNPAGQITSQTRSNDVYAWHGAANANTAYTANGLNEFATAGSASPSYDANGNLTSDGTTTYTYDAENRLTTATKAGVTTTLSYDPLGRLWRMVKGSSETRFVYDGDHIVMELDGSGNVVGSYVHGTGADEPLVWYEGSGIANPRYLSTDERGSVVAVTDASGNRIAANSYDEYGNPGSANAAGERFQFTGQVWLSEIGLYYYKARMYDPRLGRFLQTDPVGAEDSPNLYQYAVNDPVNLVDPLGLDPNINCPSGEGWDTAVQQCISTGPGIEVDGRSPYSLPGGIAWGNPQPSLYDIVTGGAAVESPQRNGTVCTVNAHGVWNDIPTRAPTRKGAYGVPETPGTAAIDRNQWLPSSSSSWSSTQKNVYLNQYRLQISGYVPNAQGGYTQVFNGVSDNMAPPSGVTKLENRFPGRVIFEIPGGPNIGNVDKMKIKTPSALGCPHVK